ncbi:hypothetical protein E2C01_034711 [Portunus trituberculatus]|uniref:Uncharacterized protein n=1 Tax=Portunus trituberculatus TaxID=210409 RepID=A0A5B7F726_PORTR|nr:hypothetical protein [Portunus trituberculatus]
MGNCRHYRPLAGPGQEINASFYDFLADIPESVHGCSRRAGAVTSYLTKPYCPVLLLLCAGCQQLTRQHGQHSSSKTITSCLQLLFNTVTCECSASDTKHVCAAFSVPHVHGEGMPGRLDADGHTKRYNFKATASGKGGWRRLAVPLHFEPDAARDPQPRGAAVQSLSLSVSASSKRVFMAQRDLNLRLIYGDKPGRVGGVLSGPLAGPASLPCRPGRHVAKCVSRLSLRQLLVTPDDRLAESAAATGTPRQASTCAGPDGGSRTTRRESEAREVTRLVYAATEAGTIYRLALRRLLTTGRSGPRPSPTYSSSLTPLAFRASPDPSPGSPEGDSQGDTTS